MEHANTTHTTTTVTQKGGREEKKNIKCSLFYIEQRITMKPATWAKSTQQEAKPITSVN